MESIENNKKNEMSLLEENIRTKGENAYYYAHKSYVDSKNENLQKGQVVSGPGIITGGDPVLLEVKEKKEKEIIVENKKFTKYLFIDDGDKVQIKIEVPEEFINKLSLDIIVADIKERSINLTCDFGDKNVYYFVVKKLCKKVKSEESKVKLSKDNKKIIITLKKVDEDDEWEKLTD